MSLLVFDFASTFHKLALHHEGRGIWATSSFIPIPISISKTLSIVSSVATGTPGFEMPPKKKAVAVYRDSFSSWAAPSVAITTVPTIRENENVDPDGPLYKKQKLYDEKPDQLAKVL